MAPSESRFRRMIPLYRARSHGPAHRRLDGRVEPPVAADETTRVRIYRAAPAGLLTDVSVIIEFPAQDVNDRLFRLDISGSNR